MASQLTTRAQVNGYRFLIRRLEHALIRRDVRMLHDPMRVQWRSLVVGLVLGLLGVAGAAILSFLHPQGAVDNNAVIVGKDSGALYVMLNGTLHPALNLASARLIAGADAAPTSVKESELMGYPRGPMLGIPGAPATLPGAAESDSDWTACDTTTPVSGASTLVFAGRPRQDRSVHPLGRDEAVLVSVHGTTYLLYDGKHAQVDLTDDVIARSLKLAGAQPRAVGAGLLDATVPVPAIAVPTVPMAGQPGPVMGAKVGSVIKVNGINSSELYVAVTTGVQPISPFAAEVLRNANSVGDSDVIQVTPDALSGVPVVNTLALNDFPVQRPKVLSADDFPVVCSSWSKPADDRDATIGLTAAKTWPLPASATPVPMASGGVGPDRIDAAYVRPSSGEFVQITGIVPGSVRRDGLFYIADTGIRYGIPDLGTARMLGMPAEPKLAPWEIVGLLIPGPELTRSAALVAHDTLPDPRK
ncbi:type VII secretion protein EccB [Nocardia sp. NPDC005998]|uniref:type VII secretion protein EccB n=1 Tax=Nocardia sp. NPDC005998 TaxID=3156894 RepID=UPI0033A1B299